MLRMRVALVVCPALVAVTVGLGTVGVRSVAPAAMPDGRDAVPVAAGVAARTGARVGLAVNYGDSLTASSAWWLGEAWAAEPGWRARTRAFPGIAACDMVRLLREDLRSFRPDVVTIETAGNALSDCMRDARGRLLPMGSSAYFDRYTDDLDRFFSLATGAGARVVYLVAPPMQSTKFDTGDRITRIARRLAARYGGVTLSNGPRNAVSDAGRFVTSKRCLLGETVSMGCDPRTDRISVRSPDGVHFWPVVRPHAEDGVEASRGWAPYASGEYRFAHATVDATLGRRTDLR